MDFITVFKGVEQALVHPSTLWAHEVAGWKKLEGEVAAFFADPAAEAPADAPADPAAD